MADLTAHPQESFAAAANKDVVQAEDLHRHFLEIYREHSTYTSIAPEITKYAETSRDTGMMLKELARQLEVAGRNTKEIRTLSQDWLINKLFLVNSNRGIAGPYTFYAENAQVENNKILANLTREKLLRFYFSYHT